MSIYGSIFQFVWQMLPIYAREKIIKEVEMNAENRLFEDLRNSGYRPQTIIDVGAHNGLWAKSIQSVFPNSKLIMIEAKEEKRELLESLDAVNKDVYISVLSDTTGENIEFHVEGTASSYYPETTDVEMSTQIRQTERLDSLLDNESLANVLLKLDVQGAELDIINGGTGILDSVSAIYAECSLTEYNEGAPLVEDVISALREKGYVPYSIANKQYRGDQIIQIDVLFVNKNSEAIDDWQRDISM